MFNISVSTHQESGNFGRVFCSEPYKAEISVGCLCLHLQALLKAHVIPSSLRLLAEFIYLWLCDWCPHFLASCWQGSAFNSQNTLRSLPRGPLHKQLPSWTLFYSSRPSEKSLYFKSLDRRPDLIKLIQDNLPFD